MVEGTALDHVRRAFKSVTTGSVTYDVGQMVDYWREPDTKDTPGWHGPHRVVSFDPDRGQVRLKVHGVVRPNRLQDVRPTILVAFGLYSILENNGSNAMKVDNLISQLPTGIVKTVGYVLAKGRAVIAKGTWNNDLIDQVLLIAQINLGLICINISA